MTAPSDPLDDLLPLLQPRRSELHLRATLLETSDRSQLLELAANPKVRRFLLARLSDTVALVDPDGTDELARVLLAEGHTPRMLRGADR